MTKTRTIKISVPNFASAIEEFINKYYFFNTNDEIVGLNFTNLYIPDDLENIEIEIKVENNNDKENTNDYLPSDSHHDAGTS